MMIPVQIAAGINVFATNKTNLKTGYGKMEAGLIRGLGQIGVNVRMVDEWSTPYHPVTLIVGNPGWGYEHNLRSTRRWCYTMSESNQVSRDWVRMLNVGFERVLVPCPALVDIYQESGVRIPVHFVPLGVDFDVPPRVERDLLAAEQASPEKPFTFLTYSLGDTRKGAEHAMLAFNRLFGGDMRYRLVIKCRDNPMWLTGLDDPQITLLRGETSAAEYRTMMDAAHAMIFPSRGEGFGYPPREAALNGMPVLATEALGMWDVAEWGIPIPVKEMRRALFDEWEANAAEAEWWEPDWGGYDENGAFVPGALDQLLQDLVQHYGAALAKAKRGREYLLSHFLWQQSARAIMGLME